MTAHLSDMTIDHPCRTSDGGRGSLAGRSRLALAALISLMLCGCQSMVDYEDGKAWCNCPLTYPTETPFEQHEMEFARRGYLYALAGAYVLQGDDQESKDHYFRLPSRMCVADRPQRDPSGFEVVTFRLREHEHASGEQQVIVAFVGSNDAKDWLSTDLGLSTRQYELARAYVKQIAAQYPGTPLVVTGHSLGGALAGHVAKRSETSALVNQAWLFNSSPRLYANDSVDPKIWHGALRGEALTGVRDFFLLPGYNKIGSPTNQTADDIYLIAASPTYGHYRWSVTRSVLFMADFAHRYPAGPGPVDPQRHGEPLSIIKDSYFGACKIDSCRGTPPTPDERAPVCVN